MGGVVGGVRICVSEYVALKKKREKDTRPFSILFFTNFKIILLNFFNRLILFAVE